MRNHYAIVQPIYALQPGTAVAAVGCGFVARSRSGQLWQILVAHLPAYGKALDDFESWAGQIFIRYDSEGEALPLALFDGKGRKLFKGPPGKNELIDVIALPLEPCQAMARVSVIDLGSELPPSAQLGETVILRGYPPTTQAWPSPFPAAASGRVVGESTIDLDPGIFTFTADCMHGFSGAPVLTTDKVLRGMLIAGDETMAIMLPSDLLWRFLNDGEIDDFSFRVAGDRLQWLPAAAGIINASTLIANNVIVTGHIASNQIVGSHIQNGALLTSHLAAAQVTDMDFLDTPTSGISTSELNPWGSSATVSVGVDSSSKVLLSFGGSFKRAGGTSPLIAFRIYRGGSPNTLLAESQVGGSGVSDNESFIVGAVDKTPTAAAGNGHYFATAVILSGTTSPAAYNDAVLSAMVGKR